MASELGVQTIQHTNGTDALTIDASGNVSFSGTTNIFGMETISLSSSTANFTIPSGAKVIWVSWHNADPPSSSNFAIRLGDSVEVKTSGYNAQLAYMYSGGSVSESAETGGFNFGNWAPHEHYGNATITLVDATNHIYACTGQDGLPTYDAMLWSSGTVALPNGELTTVQLLNFGAGAGNFTNGTASVIYAG